MQVWESCEPAPPLQPIAPMILPPATSGTRSSGLG
jgi:hypothetical protein